MGLRKLNSATIFPANFSQALPNGIVDRDVTGLGLEQETNHGTSVAEVIHETAPEVQLYLYRVRNVVDLDKNAVQDCIHMGVRVIITPVAGSLMLA